MSGNASQRRSLGTAPTIAERKTARMIVSECWPQWSSADQAYAANQIAWTTRKRGNIPLSPSALSLIAAKWPSLTGLQRLRAMGLLLQWYDVTLGQLRAIGVTSASLARALIGDFLLHSSERDDMAREWMSEFLAGRTRREAESARNSKSASKERRSLRERRDDFARMVQHKIAAGLSQPASVRAVLSHPGDDEEQRAWEALSEEKQRKAIGAGVRRFQRRMQERREREEP